MKKPELFLLGLDGGVNSHILGEIEKGNLKNFKRLMDMGTRLSDCRPAYPSISATCWSTIQTGASPAVHGITDENIVLPGAHLNEFVTGYHGDRLLAERFWEAAARKGKKSLVVDFCVSGPARSDLVHLIGGTGSVACGEKLKDEQTLVTQHEIPEQLYMLDGDADRVFPTVKGTGSASSGKWQPQFKLKPGRHEKIADNRWKLHIDKKDKFENPHNIEPFYWVFEKAKEGINVAFNESDLDAGKHWYVPMNGWSEVIARKMKADNGMGTYRFRIKAMRINDEGGFFIFITPSVNMKNVSSPKAFANRVDAIDEIPSSNAYSNFFLKEGNIDTAFEYVGFVYEWYKKLIMDSMQNDPVEIMSFVQGYPDTVNHMYRGVYEKVEKASKEAYETAVYAYKKTYEMADEFIGWLLDNVMGKDTLLVLLSDHGAVGCNRTILPHDYFEQEGMLKYIPEPDGRHVYWRDRKIDWANTKAFPVSCASIYVNLKGRQPEGSVELEDYDKTVQDIIRVLQNYHWNEQNESYLAFAVEKRQAGFVGLGDINTGDVIYGLSGNSTGGYIGGVHACQIPTAMTDTGDIRCLCVFAGKNVKKGQVLDRAVDLQDIAPTLSYMLKYPQPKHATGGVVFQIMEQDNYSNE